MKTEASNVTATNDPLLAAGAMAWGGAKHTLREAITKDPLDALAVTVLGGAYLFYLAERGHNPKVTSYYDALVFVSTNLSVGYAHVFAVTPVGEPIATAIMSVGPALAARALDPTQHAQHAQDAASLAVQQSIADRLDAILEELRRQSASSAPSPKSAD